MSEYYLNTTIDSGCLTDISLNKPTENNIDFQLAVFDDNDDFKNINPSLPDHKMSEIFIAVLITDGVFQDFKAFINGIKFTDLFSLSINDLDSSY